MFLELSKRFRNSISFRVAVLFSVTFSICLILSLTFTYFQISYSLEKADHEVIVAKWREISAVLASDGIEGLREFLSIDQNRLRNAPYLFRIINNDGETLYLKPSIQEEKFDFEKVFKQLSNQNQMMGWQSLPAICDEDRFEIYSDETYGDTVLQVGKSSEDRESLLEQIVFGFSLISGFLVLLSSVTGYWYAKKSLKPIRQFNRTIKSIESGDFSKRVTLTNSKDELSDLGETFNRMIARVEGLIQSMRDSFDSVAHDIRTPLTRIRVIAEEAILSNDPQKALPALEECAENILEVTEFLEQLLDISEAEAGTMKLKKENLNISQLLNEILDIYEHVASEKKIRVISEVPANLTWNLDRRRIKQVIGNLLDNSIKYSPDSSEVKIVVTANSDSLQIKVVDQGIGINPEELPFIWDRHYRITPGKTSKGVGLGLSIVRSIVHAHGGDVQAHRNTASQSGCIFLVIIPGPTK